MAEEKESLNIYQKLMHIQNEIRVNKSKFNKYGNFSYRSCEDILTALKPIALKYNVLPILEDEIEFLEGRFYIVSTAKLIDTESKDEVSCTAKAREPEHKSKMDDAQVTGSSSTYARKYALSGLLALDDNKDPDSQNNHTKTPSTEERDLTAEIVKNNDLIIEGLKHGIDFKEKHLQMVLKYSETATTDVAKLTLEGIINVNKAMEMLIKAKIEQDKKEVAENE